MTIREHESDSQVSSMKNDEHIIIGFVIGILAGVFGQRFIEYFDFILYMVFVGLTVSGSIVPNLIESPREERNRHFFHSVVVLGILVILFILLILGKQTIESYLFLGFTLGFVSFTPRCNKSSAFTQILVKA